MNINSVSGFTRLGHFSLNTTRTKSLIRLHVESSQIKHKYKRSYVYLIVVNNIIYKVGSSRMRLVDFGGYGVGNAGRPSIRTTGIHYYIARECSYNQKVEFWYKLMESYSVDISNLFGETSNIECLIDPRQMELLFLQDIHTSIGKYPVWNKQEHGRVGDWENTIVNIHKCILNKNFNIVFTKDQNMDLIELFKSKYK